MRCPFDKFTSSCLRDTAAVVSSVAKRPALLQVSTSRWPLVGRVPYARKAHKTRKERKTVKMHLPARPPRMHDHARTAHSMRGHSRAPTIPPPASVFAFISACSAGLDATARQCVAKFDQLPGRASDCPSHEPDTELRSSGFCTFLATLWPSRATSRAWVKADLPIGLLWVWGCTLVYLCSVSG